MGTLIGFFLIGAPHLYILYPGLCMRGRTELSEVTAQKCPMGKEWDWRGNGRDGFGLTPGSKGVGWREYRDTGRLGDGWLGGSFNPKRELVPQEKRQYTVWLLRGSCSEAVREERSVGARKTAMRRLLRGANVVKRRAYFGVAVVMFAGAVSCWKPFNAVGHLPFLARESLADAPRPFSRA